MGDSLECGGSAEQAVNLIPSETRTVFLGFEVHSSWFSLLLTVNNLVLDGCSPIYYKCTDWIGYLWVGRGLEHLTVLKKGRLRRMSERNL